MSESQQRRRSTSTPSHDATESADGPALREPVTLVKGSHRWTFSCEAGDEASLLKRLSELASDRNAPFDWFDAALVSHQLSKRLKPGLQRIDGGKPAPRTGV
jgi:hypothetical protein